MFISDDDKKLASEEFEHTYDDVDFFTTPQLPRFAAMRVELAFPTVIKFYL